MSVMKLFFLVQLLFIAICGCESRECVGDGTYVDFPRNETRKAEGPDGRQCSDIPHNLSLFDEDTPDSACKHKYCPSCILLMRKYCLPQDNETYCEPLQAQLKHKVCNNGRCENERFDEGTEKVCKAIGAHCDGLCGDMIEQIFPVSHLIDEYRATPFKICKTFKLC